MTALSDVGIRWTVGDVSDNGWEALRLSILGARRVFGPSAAYAVCVNSVPLDVARGRVGEAAGCVEWLAVTREHVPAHIRACFDGGMAEGVAWKLAPLRLFPERWEISLDNDLILWDLPDGLRRWLETADPRQCLLDSKGVASMPACRRPGQTRGTSDIPTSTVRWRPSCGRPASSPR